MAHYKPSWFKSQDLIYPPQASLPSAAQEDGPFDRNDLEPADNLYNDQPSSNSDSTIFNNAQDFRYPSACQMQTAPSMQLGHGPSFTSFGYSYQPMQDMQMPTQSMYGDAFQTVNDPYMQYMAPSTLRGPALYPQSYSGAFPATQDDHHTPEDDAKHHTEAQTMAVNDGEVHDSEMDDPSAQLMGELNGSAHSSTPNIDQAPHQYINDYRDNKNPWPANTGQQWMNFMPTGPEAERSMMEPAGVFRMYGTDTGMDNAPDDSERFEEVSSEAEEQNEEYQLVNEQADQTMTFGDEDMQGAATEDQALAAHDQQHLDMRSDSVPTHESDAEPEEEDMDESEMDQDLSTTYTDQPMADSTIQLIASPEDITEDEAVDDDNTSDTCAPEDAAEDDTASTSAPEEADLYDSGNESTNEMIFEGKKFITTPLTTISKRFAASRKEDRELHAKAFKLIPHHLPERRYWAAVLMHTVEPHKAKTEKDFIWMKGSRINTVETIWNKYREVTTEEKHQLFFRSEIGEFEDVLEELDVFNDHLVVFRAVVKRPTEVIEVD